MRYRYAINFKTLTTPVREIKGQWECDEEITDLKNFELLQEIAENLSEDSGKVVLPEHLEILDVKLLNDYQKKKNRGNLSHYTIKPVL